MPCAQPGLQYIRVTAGGSDLLLNNLQAAVVSPPTLATRIQSLAVPATLEATVTSALGETFLEFLVDYFEGQGASCYAFPPVHGLNLFLQVFHQRCI